jgi:uncharacterized membrane protein
VTLLHRHPVNRLDRDLATPGQRAAEALARGVGSWRFLIIQTILVALWIALNVTELLFHPWDPFPFILLNLLFSVQAAYTGPILLIAANRSAERDRLLLEHDAELVQLEHAELLENTRLTREIHNFAKLVAQWVSQQQS